MAHWLTLRVVGAILLVLGIVVLLEAFVRFVLEGVGTPAPVAPTERLVEGEGGPSTGGPPSPSCLMAELPANPQTR